MKVLQVCLRVPFPPADGGTIAMYNMATALKSTGANVKILALNTKKHFIDPASLPAEFVNDFKPVMVYLNAAVKIIPAFFNLFSNKSYNISRFDIELFHKEVIQTLESEKFDVIQLESIFVAPYLKTIRLHSKAKVVLRAHNVEYLIWERLAHSENNIFKKWYLQLLTGRLKQYEASVFNLFDGIISLTKEDKSLIKKMGCDVPVLVNPISLNTGLYQVNPQTSDEPVLFHLASMDWLPNIEAADWFLQKVYPVLSTQIKDFRIYFAGKSMPERILKLANEHLIITGRVDDSKQFMYDKQIMLVPLLSGGGMRVKIIEGFAAGKVIISTSIGAEGINYTDGENILIANTPQKFCDAIIECLSNRPFCSTIGANARKLAEKVYDNNVIGKNVISFYNEIHCN